jgi:xanthine dehydrogenase YagS FAD-binding subunit
MNKITHIKATTIAQATSALGAKAAVIAGGTDLFGVLKGMILPNPPDTLVNIKTIPGMDYIKEEGGVLKIGALAKLTDISEASIVLSKYPALAEAAHKVGTPALRNMGTIGGNLCQECRCWYYRAEHNAFLCFRKGGPLCYAIAGDNRYNAILGGQVCFAVCPSDTAIALTALDATLVTTQRNIPIKDFFTVLGNALKDNEIITEVQVPAPKAGTKQAFLKFARRKAIDFAIASASVAITTTAGTVTDARIVLGGVAPVPYRATAAEDALKGKAITAALAETAGVAAVKDAMPLANNKYKVQIAKTLVKRAILASI